MDTVKKRKAPGSIDHLDPIMTEHKRKQHAAQEEALTHLPPEERDGSMFRHITPEQWRRVKIELKP